MKIRKLLLATLFLACILSFIACGGPIPSYRITFVDYDGTVLYEEVLRKGKTPNYSVEEPSRESTAEYTYTFVGWDKVIAPATEIVNE